MRMNRIVGIALAAANLSLLAGCSGEAAPEVVARAKDVITVDGLEFRDLEADGELAPFEDWRLSPEARADDLVSRMSVAEKVGTLMHSTLPTPFIPDGQASAYDMEALAPLIGDKHVTSFITRLSTPPAELAEENNRVQELAEATRLGIPVTISTDPRNHFQYVPGATSSPAGNTQWPEVLGFAALGDEALMRRFTEIARDEYRAVGIHMALSPQVDLLTEPRWSRATGTFGSDAELTSRLGAAYVAGFQGGEDGLAASGVMTVAKHWVGYGAQPEGWDAHNYYGRFATPGAHFGAHVDAFRGAIGARTSGIMPAYPILTDVELEGQLVEQVSPGYSAEMLEGLLRGGLGFEGFLLSDWAITRDCNERCRAPTEQEPQGWPDVATPWGVEELSVRERYVKGIMAGLDQFGGTDDVAPLLEAMEAGEIPMERLDASVRRVLVPKFQLGLFENPYVDPTAAEEIVGAQENFTLAAETQARAQVLLANRDSALPFAAGARVWLFGMDAAAAEAAGLVVVDDPAEADFSIIRTQTPFERLHPLYRFGSLQNEGRLDFRDGDPAYEALKTASEHGPVAFAIFLDRPAILTNVVDRADVVLGNFGASDAAVLQVLLGEAQAQGRMPFALPRSMESVEAQDPGAANDTADPLFPLGAGL